MNMSFGGFKFKNEDGVGLLSVIMLTGALAGTASVLSEKIAQNSRLLHREIRNPMSVELTDVPFYQVVNDDVLCGTTNMMTGMGNFSLDGTLDSNLGNKIREMDSLSYEIGGTSNYIYERKVDTKGLYTKLGLKQFEMYQTGAIVSDSMIHRVPVGFVKVIIEDLGKAGGPNGTPNSTTPNSTTSNGNTSTPGGTTMGTGGTAGGGGGTAKCTGKDARTDSEGAINAFSDSLEAADAKYSTLGFVFRAKNIVAAAKQAAMDYLAISGSPACKSFIEDALATGIDAGISSVFSSLPNFNNIIGKAVSASRTGAIDYMENTLGLPVPSVVAETLPGGWGTEVDGKAVNESVVSKNGDLYKVTRTLQSMMYIELTADLVSATSCYSPVSSRSLCLDSGGVFGGTTSGNCTL